MTATDAARLAAEEQARADFYALLARLLYAPPDRGLLEVLAASPELDAVTEDSALAAGWAGLRAEAGGADVEKVSEEYAALFLGTGKAAVTLYAGAYLDSGGGRNPLVEVRDFMLQHGFARRINSFEPEDHVAALCDIMRQLIVHQRGIDFERQFFRTLIQPAARSLCNAIAQAEGARFYRAVAALASAYFEIEQAAFEIE